MQQRRLRLGDILDDYCPRERRITNHVVVAMVAEDVKQTRCTTCDAEHEYKHAKAPPTRRKKTEGILSEPVEGALRARPISAAPPVEEPTADLVPAEDAPLPEAAADAAAEVVERPPLAAAPAEPQADAEPVGAARAEDEGPVHRRLIRATLPRPEGQVPERKAPDFTIRQPGARGGREFDGARNGHSHGRGPMRAPGGASSRFGGHRSGSGQAPRHGSGHGAGHGSRHGSGAGQRPHGNRPGHAGQRGGGRPGLGHGRGGGGRKRGR